MDETKGDEKSPSESPVTPPDEGNYEGVSGGETTPQTGAPDAATEEQESE